MELQDKIPLEDKSNSGDEYIIGHVKGVQTFFSKIEAISLINELSGVLLADEYRNRGSQKKHL